MFGLQKIDFFFYIFRKYNILSKLLVAVDFTIKFFFKYLALNRYRVLIESIL